jgi:hypothetical protein
MHETIKFDVTVRLTLSEKLAFKKTKRFDKKVAFFVDFEVFFRTIDGLLWYGTVR